MGPARTSGARTVTVWCAEASVERRVSVALACARPNLALERKGNNLAGIEGSGWEGRTFPHRQAQAIWHAMVRGGQISYNVHGCLPRPVWCKSGARAATSADSFPVHSIREYIAGCIPRTTAITRHLPSRHPASPSASQPSPYKQSAIQGHPAMGNGVDAEKTNTQLLHPTFAAKPCNSPNCWPENCMQGWHLKIGKAGKHVICSVGCGCAVINCVSVFSTRLKHNCTVQTSPPTVPTQRLETVSVL